MHFEIYRRRAQWLCAIIPRGILHNRGSIIYDDNVSQNTLHQRCRYVNDLQLEVQISLSI